MRKIAIFLLALIALKPGAVQGQIGDTGITENAGDITWTFTANGQSVQVDDNGVVNLPNVSAPDFFGPGGPGTAPDFVSDDFIRVIGYSDDTGIGIWAISEFFRIVQGENYTIQNWFFTAVPPPMPVSIDVAASVSTITEIGGQSTMVTMGTLQDGSEADLTGQANWTSYRVSNANIATVDENGVLTAHAPGMVFVTATNEGVSGVAQVDIALGDPLTTVEGFVVDTDGNPVSDANIDLAGLAGVGTTDANGQFTIENVATVFGQIGVLATKDNGTPLFGFQTQLEPVPGGITDAGIITMDTVDPDTNIWLTASGDWTDDANWSQGEPPTETDNVILPAFRSDSIIRVNEGAQQVKDLDSDAELEIAAGASLTVKGQATIAGNFTMRPGSTLTTDGNAASFNAMGPTDIDGANLFARNGSTIALPQLIHYRIGTTNNNQSRTWEANGFGSAIIAQNLKSALNDGHFNADLRFNAVSGGNIDLSGLQTARDLNVGDSTRRQILFNSDGFGSAIDLSGLIDFLDIETDQLSELRAQGGGSIDISSLTKLTGVNIVLGNLSSMQTQQITSLENSRVLINQATVDLSNLTDAAGSTIEVENTDVTLPNLSNIDSASFFVRLGGSLTVAAAEVFHHNATGSNQTRTMSSEGSGSELIFSNLQTISNGLYSGSDIDIFASSGGAIRFPALVQIVDDNRGNGRNSGSVSSSQRDVQIRSEGFGTTIELPMLETFWDANANAYSSMSVQSGGSIVLGALKEMQAVQINLDNLGSMALDTLERSLWCQFNFDRSTANLSALVDARHTRFDVVGATMDLVALEEADGASFYASSAGTINCPTLDAYFTSSTANHQDYVFSADGAGSSVNMPALKSILNGTSYNTDLLITAQSGGSINLSAVEQMLEWVGGDTTQQQIVVTSDGFSSLISLSSLQNFLDRESDQLSQLNEINGGEIDVDLVNLVTQNVDLNDIAENVFFDMETLANDTPEDLTEPEPLEDEADIDTVIDSIENDDIVLAIRNAMEGPALDGNAIRWITEGDGDWGEPSNWSTGVVPESGDDVLIDIQGMDITVTVGGDNFRCKRLVCEENLVIASNSLTVHGPSEVNGDFSMNLGSHLLSSGVSAQFIANGATLANGANFTALKGGLLSLPFLSSYDQAGTSNSQQSTFLAIEPGSRLDFPTLTTLTAGPRHNNDVMIFAEVGGVINMGSLTTIDERTDSSTNQKRVWIDANGVGSVIALPNLERFTDRDTDDYGVLRARNGGEIQVPGLREINAVRLMVDDGFSTMAVPELVYATSSRFEFIGGSLPLPKLMDFSYSTFFVDVGTVTIPAAENADGATFYVTGGASLTVPNIEIYDSNTTGHNQNRYFICSEENSLLSFPDLKLIVNGDDSDSELYIEAYAGGTINLAGVTRMGDPSSGNMNNSRIRVLAFGANTTVDLEALVQFEDRDSDLYSTLEATRGGTIDTAALTEIAGVSISDDGSGTLDLSQLATFHNGDFYAGAGSSPAFPALEDGFGTRFTIDHVALALPELIRGDRGNFFVYGGGSLTLTQLLSYEFLSTGNNQDKTFLATEPGSQLIAPALVEISNGNHQNSDIRIASRVGGLVQMDALKRIFEAEGGSTRYRQIIVEADGIGSATQLPQLVELWDDSTYGNTGTDGHSRLSSVFGGVITASNLARINATELTLNADSSNATSNLQTLVNSILTLNDANASSLGTGADLTNTTLIVDGRNVDAPDIASIDGANITVRGGAVFTLPGVSAYEHNSSGSNETRRFRVEGAGSSLVLANLVSVQNGAHYNANLIFEALDGGSIDMSSLTQITDIVSGSDDSRFRSVTVSADGAGSFIDARSLTYFDDNNTDERSTIVASNSGDIRVDAFKHGVGLALNPDSMNSFETDSIEELHNSVLTIGGGTPDFNSLHRMTRTSVNVESATVSFPELTDIDGSSFFASGGATVNAPSVTVYSFASTGNNQDRNFRATDAILNFTGLAAVINGSHYDSDLFIQALDGGTIDMGALKQLLDETSGDSRERQILVSADGAGSEIDMSALVNFFDENADALSSLVELNDGQIDVNEGILNTENVDLDQLTFDALVAEVEDDVDEPEVEGEEDLVAEVDAQSALELPEIAAFVEARPLAAGEPNTIQWTGSDGDWSDVANWDLNRLPGPNDNVLIDVQGTASIAISGGAIRVRNLTVEENLALNGGSLTVHGVGVINGSFNAAVGTTLVADGLGASLTVNGSAFVDGLNMLAVWGGQLALPTIQNYAHGGTGNSQTRTILAFGAGSSVTFADLRTLTNGGFWNNDLIVEASAGGVINLPMVNQIADTNSGDTRERDITFMADGLGSLIDAPSLATFSDVNSDRRSAFRARYHGELRTPALQTLDGSTVTYDGMGTISLDNVRNFRNGAMNLSGAAPLLSSLLDAEGSTFSVDGITVSLPSVQAADSGSFYVHGGGSLTVGSIINYDHGGSGSSQSRTFGAYGNGSVLAFTSLRSIKNGTGYNSDVIIEAHDGGTVDLAQLTQFDDPDSGDNREREFRVQAFGLDSAIDLSGLVVFVDDNADRLSTLNARYGASIDTSGLRQTSAVALTVDKESTIATGSIQDFSNGALTLIRGASTDLSSLNIAQRTDFHIDQSEIDLAGMTTVDGSSFYVTGGGRLTVANLVNYNHASTGNSQSRQFFASEGGSRLEFPDLSTIINGTHYNSEVHINALIGGTVTLGQTLQMLEANSGDSNERQFRLDARGVDSAINLTSLQTLEDDDARGRSTLTARYGGSVISPALENLSRTDVTVVPSGTLNLDSLRDIEGSRLYFYSADTALTSLQLANGGALFYCDDSVVTAPALVSMTAAAVTATNDGSFSAPAVTNYSHGSTGNSQSRTFLATNGGSLTFGGMVNISNGTHYNSHLNIRALIGGNIDFSAVTQIVDPNTGDAREREIHILADGVDSLVDLSALVSFQDVGTDGRDSSITQRDGGVVDYNEGTATLQNVTVN